MSQSRIAINQPVIDPVLKTLTNAYDGEPFDLRMVGAGDLPLSYMCPSAASPARWHADPAKLLRLATTRRGVLNAASPTEAFICPYTGKRMHLESSELGCRMVGGFDPAIPRATLQEFLHCAAMRDGVSKVNLKRPRGRPRKIQVKGVVEPQDHMPGPTTPGDAQREAADRVVHALRKSVKP